jgi:multidrug resistance efflux pump
VNPTFNWVRLAQRIPVRVAIDAVPADLRLVAGQTATVQVLQAQARPAAVRAPAPASALHAAASTPNKQ